MKQSQLASKTIKQVSGELKSKNAQLLIGSGFIYQVMAGVYAYHHLGLRTLNKIADIVRDEMNTTLGSQEVLLSALQPKSFWETTGRWNNVDVLMKIPSQTGKEYALGPTHEEEIVPFLQGIITSYKDLPLSVYQIQTKFRDELRAKSGLLRGREFLMKDLYSFHDSPEEQNTFYDKTIKSYMTIFKKCGLHAILTEASGGDFTKEYAHEFQVITDAGEDVIMYCPCGYSQNSEIAKTHKGVPCPNCSDKKVLEAKVAEVGNIYKLGTRYSEPFKMTATTKEGKNKIVLMGSYGIGISRVMAVIAEVHHDDNGLVWPIEVSPYHVHIVQIGNDNEVTKAADTLYKELQNNGIEVLLDDRDKQPGEKLGDADLIGIPYRVVVSNKTLEKGKFELKQRSKAKNEAIFVETSEILTTVKSVLQ